MSFVGNQIVNFMVSKIKQNNPKMAPYINELMSGGNSQQVLIKAINDGAINRQEWNSAKPLLKRYGSQMNINITDNDINEIESAFNNNNNSGSNINGGSSNNNGGFRF